MAPNGTALAIVPVGPRPLSQSAVEASEEYKILCQFDSVKDINITVNRTLWPGVPDLDDKVKGKILQWQRKPPECLLKIAWVETDGTVNWDTDTLHTLCAHGLKLVSGPRGEALHLRGAARLAHAAAAVTPKDTIDVSYEDGAIRKVQTWTIEPDPECIVEDARKKWPRNKATLNRRTKDVDTPYKMWRNAMLPPKLLSNCVAFANLRLDGKTHENRKTTDGEMIRFFCSMGALAMMPGVPLEKCWQQVPGPKQLFPPLSFGAHGLGKTRFTKLMALCGHLYPINQAELDVDNPWRFCEMPTIVFNEHMQEVIDPSWNIGPDESGSAWRGKEGAAPKECPKVMCIERKPEPLCCELEDVACSHCGCILGLEINKGKLLMANAEYTDEYTASAATNLRLSKPWHQTHRAWGADSWFTGLDEMEAMLAAGLFPYGDVKTHTSRIPIKELIEAVGPNSGDWAVMTTIVAGGHKVFALGHRRGGTVHTYLSSHGQSITGKPQSHKDDIAGLGYMAKPRPCPLILNDWTSMQPKIDMQNRWRQDILAMEKRFVTQNFAFRLFTTILGMTFGNTHTASEYFVGKHGTFLEMMSDLCYDGMHNTEDVVGAADSSGVAGAAGSSGVAGDCAPGARSPFKSPTRAAAQHMVGATNQLVGYKGGKQLRCSVCKLDASFCCSFCSTADKIFVVCNPKGPRPGCHVAHKADPACKDHAFRRPSGVSNGKGPSMASKRARQPAFTTPGPARPAQGSRSGASSSWDVPAFVRRARREEGEEEGEESE